MGNAAHPVVDLYLQPVWMRTKYKFFPYAAWEAGHWWVLRFNYDFPEHEMYTIFIDGRAAADITGHYIHRIPLAASIGGLKPFSPDDDEPLMEPESARAVVSTVASYVVYGSEVGDPCFWCESLGDQDPMTPG